MMIMIMIMIMSEMSEMMIAASITKKKEVQTV